LGAEEAATRYKQGFHFVNCGADIVAVTTWMSAEMTKLRSLLESSNRPQSLNGGCATHNTESSGYT
jgi:4-hydroxy-2-oxoheptanedioate aldolase